MSEEIRNAIKSIAKPNGETFYTIEGTVKSVDWDNRVCSVDVNDGYNLPTVRLRAIKDGNAYGLVYKPATGSAVLVSLIYNAPLNGYISMFSQVDAVVLVDGNGNEIMNMDVTGGKFTFNGGNNGGLINVDYLLQRINNLETVMSAHQHAYVSPGGHAITTPDPADSQGVTPQTQRNNLEDTNFKH